MQQCIYKWQSRKEPDFGWKDIGSLYPESKPFSCFVDVYDDVFTQLSSDMSATVVNYCRTRNQQVPGVLARQQGCFNDACRFFSYTLRCP
ncbi:MAG: hypothetical protein FJW68_00265 [Actinobacteria bacterium]|nr:hypothetical protein [Actinomycetota bacterium]